MFSASPPPGFGKSLVPCRVLAGKGMTTNWGLGLWVDWASGARSGNAQIWTAGEAGVQPPAHPGLHLAVVQLAGHGGRDAVEGEQPRHRRPRVAELPLREAAASRECHRGMCRRTGRARAFEMAAYVPPWITL